MMRYKIWQPAGTLEVPGKGEFPQQFALGAFDRSVGTVVPLTIERQQVGMARIVAAEVAPDGSGATITYETVDPGE